MFDVAQTDAEWQTLIASKSTNICRSLGDVVNAIATNETPLSDLPGKTIAEFLTSITWTDSGFGGAGYAMLLRHLTRAQIDQVWEMFGIGRMLAPDYEGYRCSSKGTCSSAASFICTSNCAFAN